MKVTEQISIQDVAHVSTNSSKKQAILSTHLYTIKPKDDDRVVIDYFVVVKYLNEYYPNHQFHLIGSPYSIVKIDEQVKKKSLTIVVLVWLLLFVGTAMTIMNFHYDVSMQEVQQKLYYIFTGEEQEFPLFIQIPYSIGLGLGMLLFFNHWFKKRFTDEPSPLEVELHNYQKNIDDYVISHENLLKDE